MENKTMDTEPRKKETRVNQETKAEEQRFEGDTLWAVFTPEPKPKEDK